MKESENEYCMMQWLEGKLPVPRMLAYEQMDNTSYLHMSRCKGEMACEQKFMESPKKLTVMLASGLKSLWNIAICYRSMLHNYAGRYNGIAYEGWDESFLCGK